MFQFNPDQGSEFLYYTAVVDNQPVMVWGIPGVGKTHGHRTMCDTHNLIPVDCRLSQYESVDLRGMPDIQDGHTVWYPASTLPFKGNPRFDENGPIIVINFDEATHADPSVQRVFYQLVNERRCGEHELMDNVRIVATGNRDGDKGLGYKMSLPLCNRFTHCEYVPDAKQYVQSYAPRVGLCAKRASYFLFDPSHIHGFDPSDPEIGKAFATPRSIERAIRYDMNEDRPLEIRKAQVAGAIGSAAMTGFYSYLDVFTRVIPLREILNDPHGCRVPDESDLSLMYATATNVSGAMDANNADLLHAYLERLPVDMQVYSWVLAQARDPLGVTQSDAFIKFAELHAEVFSAARG